MNEVDCAIGLKLTRQEDVVSIAHSRANCAAGRQVRTALAVARMPPEEIDPESKC